MMKVRLSKYNNWLKDNGYTPEEESSIYLEQLEDILLNTRWYLDNLDFLSVYRVSWGNYTRYSVTKPKSL